MRKLDISWFGYLKEFKFSFQYLLLYNIRLAHTEQHSEISDTFNSFVPRIVLEYRTKLVRLNRIRTSQYFDVSLSSLQLSQTHKYHSNSIKQSWIDRTEFEKKHQNIEKIMIPRTHSVRFDSTSEENSRIYHCNKKKRKF